MRILYISYVKPYSGARVHTEQFLSTLKGIHPEVRVYPPLVDQGQLPRDRGNYHSALTPLPYQGFRDLFAPLTKQIVHEFRQLRGWKPDVVILRAGRYISSLVLCRLLNIPVVLEINGPALEQRLLPTQDGSSGESLSEWYERNITLRLPTHLTVVSEPLRQYFVRGGISPSRITTIPNGVDTEQFHPGADGERVRRELGLTGKTVLGFSGTFAPWHGLDFLREAMKKLIEDDPERAQEIVLLLIGTPSSFFVMSDLPGTCTVTAGYVPYHEMPEYLAAIDIFLAPYPRIEPFYFSPLKVLEAMAMGKPILASRQGQICQLITDGMSGMLYEPGDKAEFNHKLSLLIANNEVRQRLGKSARRTIEQGYTWRENAQTVLSLCENIANEK